MLKMRSLAVLLAATAGPALAQDFDACTVFTVEDATAVLGVPAAPEPVNPKVKRPKVVTSCTYTASKEGKAVSAMAQFRFGKTDQEAKNAFEAARLQYQTKPLLMGQAIGFWSGKQGQMHVLKGRTWLTVAVGPEKIGERSVESARKLADTLLPKL